MEFSSLIFLFLFLPVFLFFSFALKKNVHNIFLLIAGLVFYAWGAGEFVLLLLISTVVNYFLGWWIDKTERKRFKKIIFLLAVSFNLGLLVYFKYMGFILDNLNISHSSHSILLPLGISFFTFQALSYIIDIYRQTATNDRNPINFGLYMTFFPKLITGPITSYRDLSAQIADHSVTLDDFAYGVRRFIIGLGKKVLIANTVALTADRVFAIPTHHQTAGLAWLGAISYTLQIYFDFSGYTDMAVGIARMCGFKLPENFNYPYIAKNIKDFWTRWHISLAWWLRDYLFLPIAYALLRVIKKDKVLKIKAEGWAYYIGTFVTFLLCGIWHGANWTFIVWGIFYGVLLIIEHAGLRKFLKRKIPFIQVFYCQLMVIIAWVIFRADSLTYAVGYLKAMFGFGSGSGLEYYPALYMDNEIILVTIIGIVGCFPLFPALKRWYDRLILRWGGWESEDEQDVVNEGDVVKSVVDKKNDEDRRITGKKVLPYFLNAGYQFVQTLYLTAILLAGVTSLASGTYNPFIYFRF